MRVLARRESPRLYSMQHPHELGCGFVSVRDLRAVVKSPWRSPNLTEGRARVFIAISAGRSSAFGSS